MSGYTADASYIDEQGKKHYFVTERGVMKDTSGLNLTLVKTASGAAIRDRSGGKLTFESGKLSRIEDANGNYVSVTRDTQGRISQVKDSFGRTAVLYYVGGRLDMLSDPAGRIVTYSYDGDGRLITVSYPDGSTVEYTYDASARLSCVKQQDGTKTVYTYTSGDRVARTEKYPAGTNPETDTPEEYMDIDYRSSRSTAVSDRSGIRKVYVFDDTGRAELEYEDVPTEIDGETVAGRFQVTGTTLYQYAEKKRTFGTSVRTTDESNNMIVNGSFEGIGESPWQFVGKRTSSCEPACMTA